MATRVLLLATIVVLNVWLVAAQKGTQSGGKGPRRPLDLIPERCPSGADPVADDNGVELFCGRGPNRVDCPPSTSCNVHPTDLFAVCCPICSLPVVPGPCRASIPSWFFNTTSDRCERFTYGGCDGNANRFATEAECNRVCPSATRERCCPLPATIQSLGSQRCDTDAQCSGWGHGLKCCLGDRNVKVCIDKPVECCCPANNTADRCLIDHLCDSDSECQNGQVCCTTTPPCRPSTNCRCGSFRQCQDPDPCPCADDVCCPKLQPSFNSALPRCTKGAECREGEKCCLTCCGRGGQCVPGVACQRPIITPCQSLRFEATEAGP